MQKHIFHKTVLREYDIRGLVGDTLSNDDAYAIGRGLSAIVASRDLAKTAIVGFDGRASSPIFAEHLLKGFRDSGFSTTCIGLCPTPTLYYAAKEQQQSVAVQITGSHNPADYNGFKIMMENKSFFGDDIRKLGDICAKGDYIGDYGGGDGHGSAPDTTHMSVTDAYIDRITRDLSPDVQPFNVVWDCGNGAVGAVIDQLVAKLSGQHTVLYGDVDGTFPNHHPDPTIPKNLEDLIAEVKTQNADFGVAFDGDGDRIGLVDRFGRILWGDQMLMLLAREVLSECPNAPILADVKASQALFDEIARLGGRPVMVPTGHSIVKTRMLEEGSPLAGEMSAHIFYSHKFYGHDDALYVALRMMNVISKSGKELYQLYDELPKVVNTPEIRIDVTEEEKFSIVNTIKRDVTNDDTLVVNTIDGIRVSEMNGWWLVRASNTQPALVARVEADNQANLDHLKSALAKRLQSAGVAETSLVDLQ